MNFNAHFNLAKKHALLSPSQYHWINYTPEKLEQRYISATAAQRGSDLHDLAHEAIRLGIKLASSNKTLSAYVADGIGYKMTCEQPLYYSDNCFGHADTIAFRRNKLRVHDLKTGLGQCSVKQLEVYAALFCLEYSISPFDIEIELRIYQNSEVQIFDGDPESILAIMDKIVEFDARIEFMRERGV
jgi:hypothetical protein